MLKSSSPTKFKKQTRHSKTEQRTIFPLYHQASLYHCKCLFYSLPPKSCRHILHIVSKPIPDSFSFQRNCLQPNWLFGSSQFLLESNLFLYKKTLCFAISKNRKSSHKCFHFIFFNKLHTQFCFANPIPPIFVFLSLSLSFFLLFFSFVLNYFNGL